MPFPVSPTQGFAPRLQLGLDSSSDELTSSTDSFAPEPPGRNRSSTSTAPRLKLGAKLPTMEIEGKKAFRPFTPLAFAPDGHFLVGIARDVVLDPNKEPEAQCHVWRTHKTSQPSKVFNVPNDVTINFDASSDLPAQLWSRHGYLNWHLFFQPEIRLEIIQHRLYIVGEPKPPDTRADINDLIHLSMAQRVPLFFSMHPLGGYRALVLGDKLYVQGRDPRRNAVLVVKELPGFTLVRDRQPQSEPEPAEASEESREHWRARFRKSFTALDNDALPQPLKRNEVRLWWGESCLLVLTRQDKVGVVLYRLNLNRPWYTASDTVARFSLPGYDYEVADVLPSPTGRFFTTMARETRGHRQKVPLLVDCLHQAGPQMFTSPGRAFSPQPPYALSFTPDGAFWVGHAQEHLYAPEYLWGKHELWALSIVATPSHPLGTVLTSQNAQPGLAVACDSHGAFCAVQSVDAQEVLLEPGTALWERTAPSTTAPMAAHLIDLPVAALSARPTVQYIESSD